MSVTLVACNGRFWFGPAPSQLSLPNGFEAIAEEGWLRLREMATNKEYFPGLSDDGRFVERLTRCRTATDGLEAGTLYADLRDVLLTEHAWPSLSQI